MPLLPLVLLLNFWRAFTGWRRDGWWCLSPFAVFVVLIVAAPILGADMRAWFFERDLSRFETVVQNIERDSAASDTGLERINVSDPELDGFLFTERTNGVLMVEFITGGGFPVKHSGYLFSSSDRIEPGTRMAERWPKSYQVRSNWFHISD